MEIGPFKNAQQLWRWTISRVSASDAIIRVGSCDASAADGFHECQVDVYGEEPRTGNIDYYWSWSHFGHKYLLPLVLSFLLNVYIGSFRRLLSCKNRQMNLKKGPLSEQGHFYSITTYCKYVHFERINQVCARGELSILCVTDKHYVKMFSVAMTYRLMCCIAKFSSCIKLEVHILRHSKNRQHYPIYKPHVRVWAILFILPGWRSWKCCSHGNGQKL